MKALAKQKLTSEERDRLKRAVKDEMAGVLPHDTLEEIVDGAIRAVLIGRQDADEEIRRALNRIDQAAGLAMCSEVLSVIRALQITLAEQEAMIREKIRKLSGL